MFIQKSADNIANETTPGAHIVFSENYKTISNHIEAISNTPTEYRMDRKEAKVEVKKPIKTLLLQFQRKLTGAQTSWCRGNRKTERPSAHSGGTEWNRVKDRKGYS